MRTVLMSMLVVPAIALARMCGDDGGSDEAPLVEGAPAEATIEVSPEDLAPQHGGTVVLAEDHAVEVVTNPGEVRAYVVNVEGQPPPPAQTTLVVNVQGADDELHPVTLVYEPELRYYVAPVVRFTPVPGPMNVVLTIQGRPRVGRVAAYVVLPAPVVEVEVARRARPSATVVVERPGVDIVVETPEPPSAHFVIEGRRHRRGGVVVVEGPRRPRGVVVVEGGGRGKFKHRKHRHRGFRGRH